MAHVKIHCLYDYSLIYINLFHSNFQGILKYYSTGFVHNMVTFVDLMPVIGTFTPCLLIYLHTLHELDVSGCTDIDNCLFVDCICACTNLKKLDIVRCIQFTQYDIVWMVPNIRKLQYFDFSKACDIEYAHAYSVLATLQQLDFVNFDPKNIVNEYEDFRRLIRMFRNVHFGINITRFFPYSGRYLRQDMLSSED